MGASGRKAKVEAEIRKDDNKVRTSRGISKEVWEARPYTRWTKDDVSPIAEAYAGLAGSQINFMKNLAGQQDGWIINRHAVPHAPHVWPEIRPDGLVRTGPPVMHWHGVGEEPEFPNGGYSELDRGSKAWKEHCRRVNENDLEEDTEHETRQDPHTHKNLAKYCFPPAAKRDEPWPHDHSSAFYTKDPESLRTHIEKWHKEEPPVLEDGRHLHIRRVKDDESLARRLDVHPMAAARWSDAKRVYFGIEGCLKADSILSAIIREDRPESVFSVPSVSLWAADEFEDFLPHLRRMTVIVVPDADWHKKPQVIAHARFAQRFLQNHGIRAFVAAPPLESGHKGVDDYLGDGGSLDELEVLDREPSTKIRRAVAEREPFVRADGLRNMERMIRDLAFFADKGGYVQVTHQTMAKILSVDRSSVANVLERLRDAGWAEVEQQNAREEWVPRTGGIRTRKGYMSGGVFWAGPEEWALRTRIGVREDLRCTDTQPYALKEVTW